MNQTAFGPQGPNYTLTRPPADPKASMGADTWFKNCSVAGAKDGTFATADFFNVTIGNLRYLVRESGISLDDGDDSMVYTAVQSIAASFAAQNSNYADDTGGVNTLVIAIPSIASYTKGLSVFVKVGHTTTGPVTLNLNSFGAKAVVRSDGAALSPRDLVGNMIALFSYDGTAFQLVGSLPNVLTAPRQYYVNPNTGSDSATGLTAGDAFQSIQAALNAISRINMNGFNITVNLANGSYSQFATVPLNGSGTVYLKGDLGTPSNVTINGLTGSASDFRHPGYEMWGVKVVSALSSPASPGIRSVGNGSVIIKNIEFGACNTAHMLADGGTIGVAGASDDPTNNVRISGSAPRHMLALNRGVIITFSPILYVTAAVTFSEFANAGYGEIIAQYSSINNGGAVTGMKYLVSVNGVISTGGGGASYLPGTAAGTTLTGGQYV